MRKVFCRAVAALGALSGSVLALEPGETALSFLKLLQAEERPVADLLKETVLSPHTGTIRRSAISQRLGRVGRYLRVNQFEFGILGEKHDGEFAAVILSAISKHDPLEVDVMALGLRKGKEETWGVAPVPGSFDNVYLGFDEGLRKRADALEFWMGSERLKRLRELHASTARAFRERMVKAVPLPLLEESNPAQLLEAFVDACLEGNLAAAMVLLGQFDGELTEEDRRLQRVMSRGLQGLDRRGHWRLLTSPDVVRLVVQDDPGDDLDAEVNLLLFDPTAGEQVNLLRFVMVRSGKRWNIELPTSLRLADEDRLTFQRAVWRERDDDDEAIRNDFEKHFEQRYEPRRGKTLQDSGRQIEKVLREGSLKEFFSFVHRSPDLRESERRIAYRGLGHFWTKIHKDSKAASDGELVEVIEHQDAGVLVFHLISTSQLDRLVLEPLVLMKDDAGWAIAPGITTHGNYAGLAVKMRDHQNEVFGMFEEQKAELSKKAAEEFLLRFVSAAPADGALVSVEEAGQLVKTFRDRLRNGRLLEAFECCALLDSADGAWEALRSLSYEYRGARRAKSPDREITVNGGKPWVAVSLRVDSGPGSVPDYPMYLVVATKEGPRIVVDVGLRLATNKGREVLNKRVWARIDEQLEEKETALVRTLFQGHVEHSKTDLAEWEKSNKSSP
ncbi:MAG: hypothetical protein VCA38_01160 [Roseibacillus sp.]